MDERKPSIYAYDRLCAVYEGLCTAKEPVLLAAEAASRVAHHAVQQAIDDVEGQLNLLTRSQDPTELFWGRIFWCPSEHIWWTGETHVCPEKRDVRAASRSIRKTWRLVWNTLDRPDESNGPESTTSASFFTYDAAVTYAKEHVLGRPGVVGVWFEQKVTQ